MVGYLMREEMIQSVLSDLNGSSADIEASDVISTDGLSIATHRYLGEMLWYEYLMIGIGASLMKLLYTADITAKPDLTLEFYYQVNRSKAGFWARQTRCVAMGHAHSEIVVERNLLG